MGLPDQSAPAVRILAFWSINDRLDKDRLLRQLLDLQRCGYDGVIFHPRFYPNQPPYLSQAWMRFCSDLILAAKHAGIEFWLYDENGWPSGSCGGELLRRFPEARQYWIELAGTASPFKTKLCRGHYLDMLDPQACRHFIDLTYERYKARLAPEAFDYVTGFFTDEPQYGPIDGQCRSPLGFIPWTPGLPREFQARHGRDLRQELPGLFLPGVGGEELRVKFWELVIDLHHQAFHRPLAQWCRTHGKELTGHVKGEEHPLFQLMYAGSCPQFFRQFSLPGIDSLERAPGTEFFGLELRSAARQFGNGRCLVEAFGGAGWGAGPDDLLQYLRFFGNLGITHFVLHQSQYRLKSNAVFDWPPSLPFHVPWKAAFADVLKTFRRQMAARRRVPVSTLLVAPHRGVMSRYEPWIAMQTNIHNGSRYPDSVAGRLNTRFMQAFENLRKRGEEFDITDERTLEQFGQCADASLQVGQAHYERLLVSEDCCFASGGTKLLEDFERRGGQRRLLEQENRSAGLQLTTVHDSPAPQPTSECAVRWQIRSAITNAFVLHPRRRGQSFAATFAVKTPVPCRLIVLDPPVQVLLNGKRLSRSKDSEQCAYKISPDRLKARNKILFQMKSGANIDLLFTYLEGPFRVTAATAYRDGPNGALSTDGPLAMDSYAPPDPADLVRSGFPFLHQPVVLEAFLDRPRIPKGTVMRLTQCHAAAAKITIGKSSLGWVWHPGWQAAVKEKLGPGRNRVRVTLVPSGLNFYGPHHHLDGDMRAVCADQFKGHKNFLDRPDAPDGTGTRAFHFLPFGLGTNLLIS